jgi:3-dehydroquinate synthase
MPTKTIQFSSAKVQFHFDSEFANLQKFVDINNAVIITDDHVFDAHKRKFKGWNCIVLKPGEEYKIQPTVDSIIEQLIAFGADRQTTLIGVGGGVITDITGYVASIYMRGVKFGFVPTSILAMVDASVGGKNGIDIGVYKNMVGTIRQPAFLLYDYSFLKSLPDSQWVNGFAEIIKHAAILDKQMFTLLQQNKLQSFKRDKALLSKLIQRNVLLKAKVVQEDEFEKANRKLLNFGHTLGHAIENSYELSHGQAISIGMVIAANLSAKYTGFNQIVELVELLEKYGLPAFAEFNAEKALKVMQSDKKKSGSSFQFILLEKIGKAVVKSLTTEEIRPIVKQLS